jgi:hypothetical protein
VGRLLGVRRDVDVLKVRLADVKPNEPVGQVRLPFAQGFYLVASSTSPASTVSRI